MRIGIDVTASIYTGTGVASYYRELVPELLKQGKDHEFVLLGYALRKYQDLTLANKKFRFPPRLMEFLWNQLHVLPVEKLIGAVDVFHAWDYLQPPAKKAKVVTTIHDLTAIKFPMYHHPLTVAAQQHRLRWVRREASLIIADSEATKRDIIDLLGIEAERIRVVYLAAGGEYNKFRIQNSLPAAATPQALQAGEFRIREIKRVREKYNIGENYLLAVGTMEPRKNLKRVIAAFAKIQNSLPAIGCRRRRLQAGEFRIQNLVIVGRAGGGEQFVNQRTENREQRTVKYLGYVAEEDLPGLYAGAAALVYPSLYEGFGLPILEAMTVGCPVVTSDRGSLKEVAGNAAILVDPESEDSIAMGIEEAIEKRAALVKRGLIQAEKFSWEKAARETLQAYERAAG